MQRKKFNRIFILLILIVIDRILFNKLRVATTALKNQELLKMKFAGYILDYLGEWIYNEHLQTSVDSEQIIEVFGKNGNLSSLYNWEKDEEELQRMLDDLTVVMYATFNKDSKYYKSDICWIIIIQTTKAICGKLVLPPRKCHFPWGHNWYQFSICIPRFLMFAHYMYYTVHNKYEANLENSLTMYVPAYIENPRSSMGWHRNSANSIMMTIPYLGAHIAMNKYPVILNSKDMLYLNELIKMETVHSGEGLYADGGYLFHNNLRAYGYINSVYLDFKLLIKLTNSGNLEKIDYIHKMLEHPEIDLHYGPLFSRTNSSDSKWKGDLGFFSIDSMKIVSVKQKDWMLQFFGQLKHLCFYEADRRHSIYAQYWVFGRQIYYKNTENIIREKWITFYPGVISLNNEIIRIASKTGGTHTFTPKQGDSIIVNSGYSIGMRNAYTIEQFNLSVIEMILITKSGYSVVYEIKKTSSDIDKTIKVSVNFGKFVTHVENHIYSFENNYSILNICSNRTLKRVSQDGDGTHIENLGVLQCEPNAENLVAFSNVHESRNQFGEISIDKFHTVEKLTLEYSDFHLFLIDNSRKEVTVAKSQPRPAEHIDFDSTLLGRKFTKLQPVTATLVNGHIYRDFVNYKRAYTKFNYY